MMKPFPVLLTPILMVALAQVSTFGAQVTVSTVFDESTSVLTDGRGIGYAANAGSGADTVDQWTFYTVLSNSQPSLVVPFGLSTATLGEQEIRAVLGSELEPHDFFMGFEVTNVAIALRSQSFEDVLSGAATASWTGTELATMKSYYSLDHGNTWLAVVNGVSFGVPSGSLEFAFVGNDGLDSTARIATVSVTYDSSTLSAAVPEPASLAVWAAGGIVLLRIRRTRRSR